MNEVQLFSPFCRKEIRVWVTYLTCTVTEPGMELEFEPTQSGSKVCTPNHHTTMK